MLLDSNIIIYAGKAEFSQLRNNYITAQACVSIISHIEVLGYHRLDTVTEELLQKIFTIVYQMKL